MNTLASWAEPGLSTPSKRVHTAAAAAIQEENWDDDFADGSPVHRHPHSQDTSPRSKRRRAPQMPASQQHENWDDDFEDDHHRQDSPTAARRTQTHARWDSSDDDDDEDGELGFGGHEEEDKTVTSRSRRGGGAFPPPLPLHDSPPPPPMPPLPHSLFAPHDYPQPFPRSPTASVFSIPSAAGHSYSSTAHLALRPTRSGSSLAVLPPSPPTTHTHHRHHHHHSRERRRLRKKSRPPRLEEGVYELEDRASPPPQLARQQAV